MESKETVDMVVPQEAKTRARDTHQGKRTARDKRSHGPLRSLKHDERSRTYSNFMKFRMQS